METVPDLFYPLRVRCAGPGRCNTPTHPPVTRSIISGTRGWGGGLVRALGHQQTQVSALQWSADLHLTNIRGGSRISHRWGRQPSRGRRQHTNFPKNCMKLRKFWSGGAPGSATDHHHDLHTLHTQTHTHTPFALTMPPFYTRVDDASPNDIKQRTLHPGTLQCQQQHVSRATTLNILNSFCGHSHIETIQNRITFHKIYPWQLYYSDQVNPRRNLFKILPGTILWFVHSMQYCSSVEVRGPQSYCNDSIHNVNIPIHSCYSQNM